MKERLKMTKSQEIVISVASILVYAMACVEYSEADPPIWYTETPNNYDY